jgi:hypothetical protein
MKKLLMTACGLAFVAALGLYPVGPAQAAPAKDPMCNVAAQANNPNWQEHYHCLAAPSAVQPTAAAQPAPIAKDPMCNIAAQANNLSWQDHYGCNK